ncbi:MAG: hypothetical protein HOP19_11575 [Acidobacteria bacterium]|nr:hypothetical protein [Acidobacteriota bacterium]
MNTLRQTIFSTTLTLAFALWCMSASFFTAFAQGGSHRAPSCTAGTASGTYGYHMEGQILGVGPFLVNGLFTHYPDGTSDANVASVVNGQLIEGPGTGGTWTIKSDCTGTGKFRAAALNLDVTYNFIATDGGEQIELLNTNPGVLLHGVGRRIAKAGKAPNCNNGTLVGAYGYRLGGSLPNVPAFIIAGTFTHAVDDSYKGLWTGTDTFNAMGQYLPRVNTGTYTINNNCRGVGFYTDNLGNKINYVMTVVDGGDTIYIMGNEPGISASGIGYRIK